MKYYMDIAWCRCERCKHYQECDIAQPYAMRQQAKEVPDVRYRIPYAVDDMSERCADFEVAE